MILRPSLLELGPVCCGSDVDDLAERRCCFFVSGCDCTPLLEASPEVLNEMPTPIGPFQAGDRCITSFRGNGRSGSHVPYPFMKGVRRVAPVHHHPQGNGRKAVEHDWRQWQFMNLAGRHLGPSSGGMLRHFAPFS